MHNLQLVLKETQPLHHAARHATQHVLGHVAPRHLLKRAGVHVLHAIIHAALDEEGAVKVDDVRRCGAVEDVELGDDRLELRVVELESDFLLASARSMQRDAAYLEGHGDLRRLVPDLLHRAVVALAQLLI